MAKQKSAPAGKRTYERKTIDDRILLTEQKLIDLRLKKKTKDDPQAKKDIATIRALRRVPNPTKEITESIAQLTKRLGG